MKKLLLLVVVLATTFTACQNKTADSKANADSTAKDSTQQKLNPALGVMKTLAFQATLAGPTPAGVINEIVIAKQEKAKQGTYEWYKTYPKGNDGKDMTTMQRGICKDTLGAKGINVIVLQKDQSDEVNYFEIQEDKLVQLDPQMKKTSSWKDFVFKKEAAPQKR
jgi:hypothetical protein